MLMRFTLDGSGWAWFIPLHNGTVSVGIVMNQAMSVEKKRAAAAESGKDFYLQSIQEARGVAHLLANAELATDVKHAADWSYSASAYASPYVRIVGDAGSFIDPYFSSGVHLALSGALSAAVTINAAIRGDCDEQTAWKWHSDQVGDRFTRFLLVVLGATKQIRHKDAPVLNNAGEDDFDEAFSIIRPSMHAFFTVILFTNDGLVIQGTADVKGSLGSKITQTEIAKAVDFSFNKVQGSSENNKANGHATENGQQTAAIGKEDFSTDEQRVLKMVKDTFADFFTVDVYYGMVANLQKGSLGLVKTVPTAMVDAKQSVVEAKPIAVVS
jgi:hypothetical protein